MKTKKKRQLIEKRMVHRKSKREGWRKRVRLAIKKALYFEEWILPKRGAAK